MNSKLFPELQRFPVGRPRREAMRRAQQDLYTRWRRCVLIAIGCIAGGGISAVLSLPYYTTAMLLAVFFFVLMLAYFWYFRDVIRRSLRRQLAEIVVQLCITCGYDLTGNESGVCPECGTKIES